MGEQLHREFPESKLNIFIIITAMYFLMLFYWASVYILSNIQKYPECPEMHGLCFSPVSNSVFKGIKK